MAGVWTEKLDPGNLAEVRELLETSPSDAEFAAEAIIESRALSTAIGGVSDGASRHAKSEIMTTSDTQVQALRTPLFAFDSVDGFKVIDSATLARAYIPKISAADRFEQLMTDFENGKTQHNANSSAYRLLRASCVEGNAGYDVAIAERLSCVRRNW